MERSRKQKVFLILVLMLSIVILSVGFAAFSVSLNISSQASVFPNSSSFSVKFSTSQNSLDVSNVVPSSVSNEVIATNGTIDNSKNPTIKGLSATFTSPGQYVEYIFYARNEGEYTAYLNNIVFDGDKTCMGQTDTTDSLVKSACESIIISTTVGEMTYTETTPVTGHTLSVKSGEQIKIRLEYLSTGSSVDGPFSIVFPLVAFVYSTIDDSSIQPVLPLVRLVRGNLDTIGSEVCIKEECFHIISSNDDAITLLAKNTLNLGGDVPVQAKSAQHASATVYADDIYNGENYSDYDGSIVERYVDAYYLYLLAQGVEIKQVRIITKEELVLLGCSTWGCDNGPSFLTSSGNYWTSTATSSTAIWVFYNKHAMIERNYDYQAYVRPVIEIPLSEF